MSTNSHGWSLTWNRLVPNSFLSECCYSENLVLYSTMPLLYSPKWISEWQNLPNYLVFTFYFLLLDFRVCQSLLTMNWKPMPKQGQWLMKLFHPFEQWLLLVVRKERLKGWLIEMSATFLNFIDPHITPNLPDFVQITLVDGTLREI